MRIHTKSLQRLNVAQIIQLTQGSSLNVKIDFPPEFTLSTATFSSFIKKYSYLPHHRVSGLALENIKVIMPTESLDLSAHVALVAGKAHLKLPAGLDIKAPHATHPDLYLGFVEAMTEDEVGRVTIALIVHSSFA